ncbi:ABC transporter permease [Clostridium oryzae]|uniref:Macrolide transporter ATP-binding /permease protein n=1 Tax=Clostridium oryzae TaxID=1450648 RepID=A0A1V4IPN6_9CLOT|nr:FtsX-like permease family protein [Clostridium oryzae]OPJ61427.1 macrolide transporter ATP-binding /permease protein [Clostridium oryzae]
MKCITNLAISNDKKNKTRSILIIIAIMLSTMLLTVIGAFCYGSIKYNHENAGQQYGSSYGAFENVTETQIHEMQLRSEFTDIGLRSYAGKVKSNKDIKLYWVDDTARRLSNLSHYLSQGTFPKQENEITAQKAFFKAMGCENPQLGDEITIQCRNDNSSKYVNRTFVISGILKDTTSSIEQKGYNVYVSKSYYNSRISKKYRYYSAYFRLDKSVSITSDNAEEVLKKLAGKCGIAEKQVIANTYYLIWALDPGTDTIAGGILIAACIVVFSVIVIYNIFQIGITQKIQEYGKIKAIGATKKQLRGIVMREGMIMAIVGIPLGLLLGCIVGVFSFDWMMRQTQKIQQGVETISISIVSIPLLLSVAAVSLITTWLALRKPMKIVSKISPVEAIRYQEKNSKISYVRKGYHSMGAKEMTFAAFSVNKKRTVMTVCTMGLSCVLFVIIANFVGNIDNEYDARRNVEYGQIKLSLDYSLNDKAYPQNNLDAILQKNPLGKDNIEQIKQISGVTDVKTRNILAMKVGKRLNSVMVLDKEGFEKLAEEAAGRGNLDYDTAVKNDAIIFGWSRFIEDEGYSLNKNIKAVLHGEKKAAEYQGALQGAFGSCDADWAITDKTSQKLGLGDSNIGIVWVNCDKDQVAAVKEKLKKLFADNEHIDIETYQDALSVSKTSTRFLQLACYTILAIMGIIGFMNMANTMIISIITRKREFGVLQAIGMTNKQLNYMLQMEGIIFTVGTVLVAVIVGIPIGYRVFRYGRSHGWIGLYIYHLPWVEILVMVLVLSVMQIILSSILSTNVRKESLVERIRYQE